MQAESLEAANGNGNKESDSDSEAGPKPAASYMQEGKFMHFCIFNKFIFKD
jgi:hypothetical protein